METNEIKKLWLEYLDESNYKQKSGVDAYRAYVKRIKSENTITPWPTVRPLSEIIGTIFDQVESEAISDGDISARNLKKRLLFNVKQIETTSLLLMIHCPGIKPRGGQREVLADVNKLISAKMKDAKKVREFYSTWTAAGKRIVPELDLYLRLHKGRKQGLSNKKLMGVANQFILKSQDKEDTYLDESQVSRSIGFAKKILRNVENGIFPGNYKS